MPGNSWKLQDAKARFSEVVRQAKAGQPQHVTVHGKEAVVVSDPTRFDVTPKRKRSATMRDFVKASAKYRGLLEGVDLERHGTALPRDKRREIFDGRFEDEENA